MSKISSVRNSDRRCIKILSYNALIMVVSKLSVLLITFILFVLNSTSRIKNVVVRFMANASFSLYSTIRSKIS